MFRESAYNPPQGPEQSSAPDIMEYYHRKKPVIEQNMQKVLDDIRTGTLGLTVPDTVSDAMAHAVMTLGGKRSRPILVYLAHDLIGGSFSQIDEAAIIPEFPHKGSLVEDDIDDNATNRDGFLPVYKAFGATPEEGVQIAKQTYELMYALPKYLFGRLDISQETKDTLWKEYLSDAKAVRDGQEFESHNQKMAKEYLKYEFQLTKYAWKYITMPYYLSAQEKCAAFRASAKLGGFLGGATKEQMNALIHIADTAGVAFQIADDLQELKEDHPNFGSDITECKMTIPNSWVVILPTPDGVRFREILKMGTTDREVLKEAVGLMRNNGVFDNISMITDLWRGFALKSLNTHFPPSPTRTRFEQLINITTHLQTDL